MTFHSIRLPAGLMRCERPAIVDDITLRSRIHRVCIKTNKAGAQFLPDALGWLQVSRSRYPCRHALLNHILAIPRQNATRCGERQGFTPPYTVFIYPQANHHRLKPLSRRRSR